MNLRLGDPSANVGQLSSLCEMSLMATDKVPVFHLRGFVRIQDQVYLIEPLTDAEAEVQGTKHSSEMHSNGGLHAVYNYKHLRRKRSSCSHGNGTTFYDHGVRPSGLFQLGSLVIIREH